VGVESFYDGLAGDPEGSNVALNDFMLISELHRTYTTSRQMFLRELKQRGKELAAKAAAKVVEAADQPGVTSVVIACHVPPFLEASLSPERKPSDKNWAPWFTWPSFGKQLLQIAKKRPGCHFLVLAGHTHTACRYEAAKNLVVTVGAAVYGQPDLCGMWTLDEVKVLR
jgi:hypothetical protein